MTKPLTLYHYTDAAGLIGIVHNRMLWATNLEHMNDSQEDKFGLAQVAAYLSSPQVRGTGARQQALLDIAKQMRDGPGGTHRYAFCMSEEGDLLSQWRGYTPSGGYSIGLRMNAVQQAAVINGLSLDRCLYTQHEQFAAISATVDPILSAVASWDLSQPERSALRRRLSNALLPVRSVIKHPSFAEEREWRLHGAISSRDKRCKWRPSGPYVRPFAEIQLPEQQADEKNEDTVFSEVKISPGMDREKARLAVVHLFTGRDFPAPSISTSAAPLR